MPNQCSADGGCTSSWLRAPGSCGAIHGPMTASSEEPRITSPVAALPLAMKRSRRRLPFLVTSTSATSVTAPSGVMAEMSVTNTVIGQPSLRVRGSSST